MSNTTPPSPSFATQLDGLVGLMRPKQWIKNAFVLAPLVFAGEFRNETSLFYALFATFMFCIAASAVYIVNDMADAESDRVHPKKSKTRPIASGAVTLRTAFLLLLVLYAALLAYSVVAPKVMIVVAAYIALNLAYTFYLKHQPVLDIFCVASGFVLRVYAGAMALSVPVSSWMFITTLCLALYLAAIKRRQELSQSGKQGRAVLSTYTVALVDRYAEMSATGALIFYSLFVTTSKPQLIFTLPLVLFGLFRYWYVVEALDLGESPTDALFSDKQMMITVILWIGACIWALL